MLPLLLLSCTGPSEPTGWADCPDPTCRLEDLERAWQEETDVVLATLPTLDPIEQESVVITLLRTHPQQQERICSALPPDSPGGRRCERVQARPHLTQSAHHDAHSFALRPGGGPPRNILQQPKTAPVDWPVGTAEQLGGCSPAEPCLVELATRAALSGDLTSAGAICRTAEALVPELYWECLFETAEAVAADKRYAGWEGAAWLCNGAEKFVHGCLHHTLALALPNIPAADDFSTDQLDAARAAERAIAAAVSGPLSLQYTDRMWALWTWQAFVHADTVTGQLLPALPEQAAPHVRLAAAYHLLKDRTDWSVSLAELTAELTAALAIQDPPAAPSGTAHTPTLKKVSGFWPSDVPGEEHLPAIYCIGDSRRATDPDPTLDAALAVLEAAGRLEKRPPADFFARVIRDTAAPEVVRWTAARILTAHDRQAAAALTTVEGLTPLIERRLKP